MAQSKEERKFKQRQWALANKDKLRAASLRHYYKNAKKRQQKSAEWKAANPDKVRAARRKHYAANREHINKRSQEWSRANPGVALRRRTERKLRAVEYKGGRCADCKGTFPAAAYDFHHLDFSAKELNPSDAVCLSWEKYKAELDKCVLLCATCHRIRHAEERA